MIRRIDRIAIELPPPSDPDPAGAAAVQELMGGRFGEMSTFLNYTFQSFNFRNRQGARPFYDLVANIAAEEFGTSSSSRPRSTRCSRVRRPTDDGRASEGLARAAQGRGESASLPRRRPGCIAAELAGASLERRLHLLLGRSRRGSDAQLLPRDRRTKQQAQGLRDGRASGGARADGIPAGSRRRPSGRLRPSDRAADRCGSDEAVPDPADPDREDPGVQAAHRARRSSAALPVFADATTWSSLPCSTAPTRRRARSSSSIDEAPEGVPPHDLPAQPAVFAPDYAPEEIAEIAQKLREKAGLPKEPTGEVANGKRSPSKPKRTTRRKATAKK